MQNAEKNVLDNETALLKPLNERLIERDFTESDQHKIAPIKKFSDHALLNGYRHLIDELENEEKQGLKKQLIDEIILFETELIRRNLLDEAHAI